MFTSPQEIEGAQPAQTVSPRKPNNDGSHLHNQHQLQPALRPRKSRRLTVGYASTEKRGVDVPYLRLRGRWLQDAGFAIGRHVEIGISEGRMTIEQVD